MKKFFKDSQFSFQALRLLGEAAWGAADIGEVLTTVDKIEDGNFESWCLEWAKTAERIEKFAKKCYSDGNTVSAEEAYLRASNYYRTSEFYLNKNLEAKRSSELYDKNLECFSFVMKFNKPVIEPVRISYEGTSLPGHFYKVPGNMPRPTLIAMTGFDGTKEEMYGVAMAAVKRGINCIAIEGPGQGEVIRKQNLVFRLDYENVITPVVDYLSSRKEVDSNAILLLGESFGGYLAPRAAAFENRLAACIANTGVFDFMGFRRPKNMKRGEAFKQIRDNFKDTNIELKKIMETNTEMRWALTHGMYVFGVKSPAEFMIQCEDYWLQDICDKIKCPTLIVDGEDENMFPGQAKQLYDLLTCQKEYMMFTSEEGAEAHCQVGAKHISNERIFNWIENVVLAHK